MDEAVSDPSPAVSVVALLTMVFSISVLRAYVSDQIFHFLRFELFHSVLMMQWSVSG